VTAAAPLASPARQFLPRAIASRVPAVASAIVFSIGALVLAGWAFDVDGLKGFFPGVIVTIPNTAVGFVFAGTALWMRRNDRRKVSIAADVLSALVLALGLAMFVERITGVDLGIDLLLFADKVRTYPYLPPGRIATNSALCFSLAGFALLTMDRRSRKARMASRAAGMLGLGVGLLALIGYLYGTSPLYAIDKAAGMALLTAIGMTTLATGIVFARPRRGAISLVMSDDAGGLLFRQMLPAAVLVTVFLGWLWIKMRDEELVSREGGVALFVLLTVGTILGLVIRSALLLRRADRARNAHFRREVDARQIAEQASQVKTDFLATMSHELRTPLNAIIGYSNLLIDGIPEPSTRGQQEKLQRIMVSAQHLLSLIEDVLSLSRLEFGAEEIVVEDVAAVAVARDVLAIIEPLATAKNLGVVLRTAGRDLTILTDAKRLRQILLNLVGNSVKFTVRGSITLEIEDDGDTVLFSVRDTGIGIAPEHQQRVFEAFWQVEQSRTRTVQGTGLGLALSKHLSDLLGAKLTLASELDKGTTVTLALPRNFAAPLTS
jgi:signal transduction histidine kinase